MVKRYKGGLMGSTEATTSTSDSRGMWGTVQATQARNTGNWPALLATETAGSGSGAGFANAFMTVSNVAVTDSGYNVLNDTPNISTAGGFIKLTGRGFVSGCVVYVGGVAATSTTFISSTEVRAQIAAATSNTLMVYVVNPDGSTGIKLSSLVFSGTPAWATGATLSGQVADTAFSVFFSATSDSAVSYALSSGSSLPPGTSLFANGLFTGTVTGISSDTTYSFSVDAIDAENQDTARTFSVTFSSGDAYFYLTSVLLNGEANVWIRDSSANNFLPTIVNDTRPVAFSPYNSNWSGFFDGTGDYLTVAGSSNLAFGTNDFTIECWIYFTSLGAVAQIVYDARPTSVSSGAYPTIYVNSSTLKITYYTNGADRIAANNAASLNQWTHVVVSRESGTTRMFIDGLLQSQTYTDSTTYLNGASRPVIGIGGPDTTNGSLYGYISNMRVLNGTGVTSVTVPTSRLTTTSQGASNCQLLTLQDNRFVDNSTNAYTVTPNGDVSNRSFAPFADTDTTTGSAYFDGTGDHLIITDSAALELGAGDFCVEYWIYPTSVSATAVVIDKRSGTYGPILMWRSSSTLQLYMSVNGSSWLVNGVTVGVLSVNRWYHVAVFRVGTSIYTSFNGVVTLVTASGSGTPVNNAANWYIGTETNGSSNPWTGYIADLRFVVGSGIYTSANFTPTTSSLSSVANTQLLTLQYRRGDNNHRFVEESGVRALTTRTGNPSQGSFSPHSPAGWSNYFNGSTDFFTWTGTAVGAGAFTVEFWFYNTSDYSASRSPIGVISTSGYNNALDVRIANSTTINVSQYNVANNNFTVPTMASNTWYHVAITRNSSNQLTVFLNGTRSTTGAVSISTNFSGLTSSIGRIDQSNVGAWFGYISNVRIVTGTNVYDPTQSTITVPTSSLTAISGTAFLSCQNNRFKDNSTNAYTITRAGSAAIQAFSPFRGSGTYSPATHGGSAYFDGSGDYVYIANSTAMTLGTNDHCIEFWMYPNGSQNQYTTVWWYSLGASSGATNTYYFSIGSDSGGSVTVLGGPLSGTWAVTLAQASPSTEYTAVLNTWTHVTITRRGSAYRLFLNGVLKAYTTYAGSIIAQGGSFSIGWDGANATTYYKGWMSNFRVINGSVPAAYQTASTTVGTTIFTPPTSVPAFEANTAMAMNFTNGGIVDASGRHTFETVGDAKISNVASKFGLGSLYFDGTGDYLSAPATALSDFGTGDFTIEFWMNASATGTYVPVVGTQSIAGSSTAGMWRVSTRLNSVNGIYFNYTTGSAFTDVTFTTTNYNDGAWHHVAVVRTSNVLKAYVDGTKVGSDTAITQSLTSGQKLFVGFQAQDSVYYTGYVDDLRITRFARYTGASLTVPTGPFLTK